MKKQFILNVLINFGIIFLIMSGVAAYKSGNMLILGLSIAISIVLIYLKIVLLKHVKQDFINKKKGNLEQESSLNVKKKKK